MRRRNRKKIEVEGIEGKKERELSEVITMAVSFSIGRVYIYS
jgi:hypothetical protein